MSNIVCQIADRKYVDWNYVFTGGPAAHYLRYRVEKNKTENVCGAVAKTDKEAYESFKKVISGFKNCPMSDNNCDWTLVGQPKLYKTIENRSWGLLNKIWERINGIFGAIGLSEMYSEKPSPPIK